MAQRLIYDGNWPQTGGNSGATAVNGDNGNTQLPHDLKQIDGGNERRDTEIAGQGGKGKYGQVGLYWWQVGGVLNA